MSHSATGIHLVFLQRRFSTTSNSDYVYGSTTSSLANSHQFWSWLCCLAKRSFPIIFFAYLRCVTASRTNRSFVLLWAVWQRDLETKPGASLTMWIKMLVESADRHIWSRRILRSQLQSASSLTKKKWPFVQYFFLKKSAVCSFVKHVKGRNSADFCFFEFLMTVWAGIWKRGYVLNAIWNGPVLALDLEFRRI